ncbi:MAG: transmembrane domain-containing protein [Trueperaceae bacterium]|nr:transmembrane domain-containing protein [Trueperaceae bacterium]
MPARVRRFGATLAVLLMLGLIGVGCSLTAPAPPTLPTTPPTAPSLPVDPAPSPPPPQPLRAWSDAAGWPSGSVPASGDVVVVHAGDVVLLDVSPPPLAGLMLHGALVFDERDLELRSDWVMVHGGLYVGSAAQPFVHRAVITLTGARADGHVLEMGMGRKVLGVMDGVLELYGDAPGPSWTRLVDHVAAGAATVRVEDATGWSVGDRVVLASTDFEGWHGAHGSPGARDEQVEERTVTSVDTSVSGSLLTLDRPLSFARVGRTETISGIVVDGRAEVARLTRNVVVQGDEGSADPASDRFRFGGHVMAMGSSRVRLQGVEFTRLGQLGVMGRYPVHFHLMGDEGRHAVLRGSSVHGSFNRCVALHGSNAVTVRDVAAYDTYGHCFFLEDGAETGNVLHGNLALMIRRPAVDDALLPSDTHHLGPAAFWVTNPDNLLVGNVAASSQGSGFWYALPEHPTGLSYGRFDGAYVWPRRTPLGLFVGNVAHSNGSSGLHVDDGPTSDLEAVQATWYRPRVDPGDPASEVVTAVFEDFVAFRHRGRGVWFRGDHTLLRGGVLFDNAIGATFASRSTWAEGVSFVGETSNLGTPRHWETTGVGGRTLPRHWDPSFAIRGFEFYDGDVGVRESAFAAFVPNDVRQASALAFLDFTSFPVSPLNAAAGLDFAPGTNRVHLASRPTPDDGAGGEDGYRSALFADLDGSVTGTAGRVVTVSNPFLTTPSCTERPAWNAFVCPGRYASLSLYDVGSVAVGLAPVTITRADGAPHVMRGAPRGGAPTLFRTLLRLDDTYGYTFAGSPGHLRLILQDVEPGDTLFVSHPHPDADVAIYRDWWIDERNRLTEYASLAALQAAAGAGFHLTGGTLHVRLVVQPDRSYAQVEICRAALCAP